MPQTAAIDPRLKEIANLVRTERRTAACVLLYLAAILLLFALIGFIPGSLNDYAEDLCLRTFGHIDSQLVAGGALIFALLVQVPILGAVALAFRFRSPADPQQQDRLEFLRKQLLAEGLAPHQLGIWTEADWSRCLGRMAIACPLLTAAACASLYGISNYHQLESKPVQISATARLDLAFRTAQRSSTAGIRGGTTINIFRLDRYGFQPAARGSHYRDTLFVPLAGPAWHPGQPFEVFYQCAASCVFSVPAGSSLLPIDVIISGRLHPSQLPFFVKRTFQRAGIPVASPYYVLTDQEQQPLELVAPAAFVGILLTAVLFGLSALYRLSPKSPSKEDMIKTTDPPMITFALNRDSVCMADDREPCMHAVDSIIDPRARTVARSSRGLPAGGRQRDDLDR